MLRRSHDHHRGLHARCNATASADRSNKRHQDRHLMTASQSCKSARYARRLSTGHGRARPGICQPPQIVRQLIHRVRHQPSLIGLPLNRRTARCIGSIPISQLARGTHIPIAPAAPPYVPSSAVSSPGGFRTPAAEHAAPSLKRPASETLHKGRHLLAGRARGALSPIWIRP